MLVEEYSKEFCRPPNPGAEHLRCVASLDADITEVLPYLNTVLSGHQYFSNPPSLTLKLPGKLVTLHPRKIAINIVKDEQEAGGILEWLKQEINNTWEKRGTIVPTFTVRSRPRVLDILKMLPKTNCGKCGKPTCMVFAIAVSDGSCIIDDCPSVGEQDQEKIQCILKRRKEES